jgi:hypothetical protein
MHGLPRDIDLPFLDGKTLLQVCVGENELILNLEGKDFARVSITVTSPMGIVHPRIDPNHVTQNEEMFDRLPKAASAVSAFLGSSIRVVSHEESGLLILNFTNAGSIVLRDDSKSYESYIIKHGDVLIVV